MSADTSGRPFPRARVAAGLLALTVLAVSSFSGRLGTSPALAQVPPTATRTPTATPTPVAGGAAAATATRTPVPPTATRSLVSSPGLATPTVTPTPSGGRAAATATPSASTTSATNQFGIQANPSADLDQCANGSLSSPNVPACNPDEWVNGNLGESKSHYAEGDSIAYRMKFDNLSLASHTVIIAWDTTKSSKHAIDYLTTYNRTVTTANPCAGVSGCSASTTFPIPVDGQVSGAGVSQIAGVFTMFGGTITGVGAYSYPNGTGFSGDKTARISITFTPTVANPVLAWGGHIATRADWGMSNSAVDIPGSPYHMRLIDLDGSGGNQDRSLSAAAVIFPASITIIKDAVPDSATDFSFTTTGGLSPSTFSLDDDANPTLSNTRTFSNILVTDNNGNNYTIVEGAAAGWTLSFNNPACSVTSANNGTQSANVGTRTVSINLREGENVTCTFVNTGTPTLAIQKVADAASVDAGSAIGYTVTVTNSGTGNATGVQITDNLPGGTGPVTWAESPDNASCTITGSAGTQVLSCNVGTLNAGASFSVHVSAPTTRFNCGTYNNTASFSATGVTGGQSSPASITVNCPNLSITKTADAAAVNAGQAIGFTVTITNSGPGAATGVTISDSLPGGAGIDWSINQNTPAASCSITGIPPNETLSCGPLTLAANGGSLSVHVTSATTSASCGTYNNRASYSASNAAGGQSSQVSTTVNCANLAISKAADAASVNAGQAIGFTVTITNNGAGSASGVTITDSLPGGAGVDWTIDQNTPPASCSITGTPPNETLSCGPVTLTANGGSLSVHVTSATTGASCGTYDNQASFSTGNAGSGQSSQASTTVNCATLASTKTADATSVNAGQPIGFTVTLINNGAGTATGVTLSDSLPAGTGIDWSIDQNTPAASCSITGTPPNETLGCGPLTLAANGGALSVHVTSGTTSGSCGTYDNRASYSGTNVAPGQSPQASTTVNCASLSITKTADAPSVNAGQPIGFTVTITNNGAGAATGVSITDSLPGGGGIDWSIDQNTPVASCGITGAPPNETLSCGPVTLAANGGSLSVHVTSRTTSASCGVYNNTASFTATNAPGGQSPQASTTVNCASLAITKTADAASVNAGQPIGFTVTLTNGGPGTATGVTIADSLPGGTGIDWSIDLNTPASSCTITGFAPTQTLSCGPVTLASGASITVHATSATTGNTCGTFTNTASFASTNATSGQSNQVSVTVNCAALGISKVADAASVNAGDQAGFKIKVTNNGAGTANNVVINDTLPSGLTWTETEPLCSITGSQLTCNIGNLASGASFEVHVTATTAAANCGALNNTASFTSTNAGSGQASASAQINCPNVAIVKTADSATVNAGQAIGFRVTITNDGAGAATGVTLGDALPGGSGIDWSIAQNTPAASCAITGSPANEMLACGPLTLAANGGSVSVHVTSPTTPASCGAYDNRASFTATNAPAGQSGQARTVVNCASLSITKTADAASVNAGQAIGFTVTLTNNGAGDATGVTIADSLPGGSGIDWLIDQNTPAASCSITGSPPAETLSCGPLTLAANGGSVSVHVTSGTTSASCGTYNNTASYSAANAAGGQSPQASTTVYCASLNMTKTADAATVNAGQPIGFTVTLTNTGAGAANGVIVSDALPGGSGIDWSIDQNTPASTCSITGSPPNETLSCGPLTLAANGGSVSVHVTSGTTSASCGTYNNRASYTATNAPSGQSPQASTTVNCASLVMTKTADASTVNAGQAIGFTVTLTNIGAGAATGVTISDSLPGGPGIDWSIDQNTPAASCSITGSPPNETLSCGPLTLAANGGSVSVHVASTTTSASCGTYNNQAAYTSSNTPAGQSPQASTTVNCASLSIVKVADAAAVSAGQPIGFTVTLTNNGTGAATGVTITDALPAGAGIDWSVDQNTPASSCGITGSPPNETLACGPLTLNANGGSVSVHVTSSTTSASCGTYNNTASFAATNAAGGQSGQASTIVNCASLVIAKTADAPSVNAGQAIGFTVTLTNNGAGDAAGVTIADSLPAGSGVDWSIDQNTPGASCSITGAPPSETLTCGPLNLAANGGSVGVHLTSATTSASCGTYNNTASYTATNAPGGQSSQARTTVNCASLSMTKTADAASVNAGQAIGFTLTLTNSGAGDATDVTITDSLPGGTGLDWSIDQNTPSNSCSITGAPPSETVSCGPLTLAANGGSVSVHVTSATTSGTCGTYANTGTYTSGNAGSGQSPQATTTVNCSAVGISKIADAASVSAGQQVGFTIKVTNTGAGTASNVVINDALPGGLTWTESEALCSITGSQLTCSIGDLTSGASFEVHVTAPTTAASCGTLPNTAGFTTSNGGLGEASASVLVNCPNLVITKAADNGTISAGQEIGFTITVTNSGAGLASGVTISDTLPAGFTWTENEPLCSIATSQLTCNVGDLAAGASFSVHVVSATTVSNCGTVPNTATVSATNEPAASQNDNSASASVTVNCASLAITKVADSASVNAGQQAGFTITVTNNGAGAATAVTISDSLPAGLTWTETEPLCTITVLALSCNVGPLAAGASFSVHVIATTSVANCGALPNTASFASTNAGSGQAQASITVTCNAFIRIVKDAQPNSAVTFGFTGDLGSFSLVDDGVAGGLFASPGLQAGTYVVTESLVTGWTLVSISCSDGSATSLTTRSAAISLQAGETVTCTFVNVLATTGSGIIPPPIIVFNPPSAAGAAAPAPAPAGPSAPAPVSEVAGTRTTAPTTPPLISEVESVRSLPSTGNGGYLHHESGQPGWGLVTVVLALIGLVAGTWLRRKAAAR